jgi:hypothetical protein
MDALTEGRISRRFSQPWFLEEYGRLARCAPGPKVCLIEDPGFAGVLEINRGLGIPTIACTHNLEAFDTAAPLTHDSSRVARLVALEFAAEYVALAKCAARLCISRTETSLLGGLGAPSLWYPYLPVGDLRTHLHAIRTRRAGAMPEAGLLLLLGTALHRTTRWCFQWFLDHVASHGLPPGTHLAVAGAGTETLKLNGRAVDHTSLRGWLSDSDLADLLSRVACVLVPQRVGFGAVTRLPELSLADVPVIASNHIAHTLDVPPGISTVSDSWDEWDSTVGHLAFTAQHTDMSDYEHWEARQARPLVPLVQQLLGLAGDDILASG